MGSVSCCRQRRNGLLNGRGILAGGEARRADADLLYLKPLSRRKSLPDAANTGAAVHPIDM